MLNFGIARVVTRACLAAVFLVPIELARVALRLTAVAVLAVLLFSPPAFAADAASATVDLGAALSALMPYLSAIASAIFAVLVGWVLMLAKNKLGISIDDSMRAALQTAVRNGAGLVLNRLGNSLNGRTIDVKSPEVAQVVTYVLTHAPDAIAHFGLTPDAIAEKIVAHIPQIANTTGSPAPAPVA